MFGLFSKSSQDVKVVDRIWMSREAKLKACAEMARVHPDCLFLVWFEDTLSALNGVLNEDGARKQVMFATDAGIHDVQSRIVMFAEHYPLRQKEQDVFARLQLAEAPVLSSLDEPFFTFFGGERLVDILKRLGGGDDEVIGHAMVTKAIRNAQEKIGKHVVIEQRATSQQEWLALNLKK